jgi:potassium-dependent mechanosensitive channel
MSRLLHLFLGLTLAILLAGTGAAQAPRDGATPPPSPVSAETKAARTKLDAFKLQLEQKEAALQRPNIADGELQGLRQEVDPIAGAIRDLIGEWTPRLDAARERLAQLGAKPEGEEESPDVQRERREREAAVAEIDETVRLGRTLLVQAEQLVTQLGDRRRALFARALFERSSGLVSPELWRAVATSLPRDLVALDVVMSDWWERVRRRADLGSLTLVGLALGIALALYAGRLRLAPRLVRRDPSAIDPPARRKLLAALGVILVGALPAVLGSYLVDAALTQVGMTPPRVAPFVTAVLGGFAFVASMEALADALLAPGRSAWRLLALGDRAAARVHRFVVVIAAVYAVGKALEALNKAIAAALPISIAARGVFALLVALLLAELLRRSATHASAEEECLGPYVPTERELGGSIRILGWIAVATVVAACVVGYVALASFLLDQLAWVAVIAAGLFLAIGLVDEFLGNTLRGETRVATTLQANTGLRRRSLQQIAVLSTGLAKLVLFIAAILLVLAPWGVESGDLLSSVRAAFFGFTVGDVTISLSTVAIALAIFAAGFTVTRLVQRWLESAYLPATDLDAGLRNSIVTAFGYLGFFVAAAFAFSYLGLSLDRIAIVAGALSVGIGFGLQSIVNNFVSGLILLWERPIRVGDLVVVGDGEGYVRRINVRATEIETFDRSTVIVPNSSLISGTVRNRVRSDRSGRVIVPVSVLRTADPARVAELLSACAADHADVLKTPPPRVFFKKIGDANLDFELMAFVVDVDLQARVQSDLNFAIFKALSAEGVIPPLAPPVMEVRGLSPVEQALGQIASAIGQDKVAPPEERRPEPKRRLGTGSA